MVDRKRIVIQAVAAFALYVIISLMLEKEFDREIVYRELAEGVVFGFIYGIFIWLSGKWRRGK